MTKQTIEIDVPEGMEIGAIELYEGSGLEIFFKKKPPRRRVFECISEEPGYPKNGDWYESLDKALISYSDRPVNGKYKIFKEVTE